MTTILRDFGHTKRCHVLKVIHTQTVAEHSHGVALLAAQLYGGAPSANLLLACLYHDLAECVTGDVPATAKWGSPELSDALEVEEVSFFQKHGLHVPLTDDEQIALKLADLLDLGFYCIDELSMGNRRVNQMYTNIIEALYKMGDSRKLPVDLAPVFWGIFNEMQERYLHATHR